VGRPFEGLTGEPDLIAMRELVSAATAPLTLSDPTYAERTVTLATVLPQLAPALVREDGRILLGLQLVASSDDVSRDIGTALQAALQAEPGQPVNPGPIGGAGSAGPRLQELLSDAPLDVTVHDDYGFWLGRRPTTSRSLLRCPGCWSRPTPRSSPRFGCQASRPRTGAVRMTQRRTYAG